MRNETDIHVVIGKTCKEISADEADDYIFGYTCVNDVTAIEFLFPDKAFQQWTRSKGFDTFTPLGPSIETGIDPAGLRHDEFMDILFGEGYFRPRHEAL